MALAIPKRLAGFWSLIAVAILIGLFVATDACAQFGQPRGGPGGPGGPNAPDKIIAKEFDANEDGVLDRAERDKAREFLAKDGGGQGRRGGGRRGGGRRGGGGPRGGRGKGGERPAGTEGPRVSPANVENFPKAGLYDANVLRTVFIEFEHEDWEKEMAAFKPTDVEIPATVTVDGKKYPNVGLSFRGASSFFMIAEGSKRSLNLSMDLVDGDQKLYGYKSLNFLNCNGDASLMSSYLYTHIASQKIATPKVNFVKVVINGRSWGIYANAQQFNKDFLKENYDTKKGNRWKVSGSPQGDAGLRYLGDDVEEYRTRFDIKSKDNPEAWTDLINLCKVLNETPDDRLLEELDPILDIDGVLWYLAADVALINSDGYWTRASDYSIYEDNDGKFNILPHDMNESFRASHGGGGPPERRGGGGPPEGGPEDRRGAPAAGGYELDPLIGLGQERFPLRSKLLANPILKTRYLQYVRMIAKDHIAWENLGPRIAEARKLIDAEVRKDTRKLMTDAGFKSSTSPAKPAVAGSLREFAEKRSEYLLNHPAIKDLPKELIELPKFEKKTPKIEAAPDSRPQVKGKK